MSRIGKSKNTEIELQIVTGPKQYGIDNKAGLLFHGQHRTESVPEITQHSLDFLYPAILFFLLKKPYHRPDKKQNENIGIGRRNDGKYCLFDHGILFQEIEQHMHLQEKHRYDKTYNRHGIHQSVGNDRTEQQRKRHILATSHVTATPNLTQTGK